MTTLLNAPVLEYSKDPTAVVLKDDHQPVLSFYVLEQLRRRRQFCDVEIRLRNSVQLQAHRVILASSSPYFMKLLSKYPNASSISLDDSGVDVASLELLIDFFYSSKLRLTESNSQAVCHGAHILQLERIEKACCKFMIRTLKHKNCIHQLKFAKKHNYPMLLKECHTFIAKNILALAELPAFSELLDIDSLRSILSLDCLALTSEQELVDMLLAWMKSDPLVKQTDIYSLLLTNDLPQFDHNNSYYQLLQALSPPANDVDTLYAKIHQLQCCSSRTESDIHAYENTSKRLFAMGGVSAQSTLDAVERYESHNAGWVPSTKLPRKKAHAALVAVEEKLYSLGGLNGHRRLNTVDVFEPEGEVWSAGPSMPTTKSDFGVACTADSEIYCVGGLVGSRDVSTVDVLNVTSSTWRDGPPLQQSRSFLGAAFVDNTIYAVGGAADGQRLASVEKLDLSRTNPTWESVSSLNIPRSRAGVAVLNGRVYAVGGYNGTDYLDSVECYNPADDKWELIESMSTPRNSPAVACFDNKLVVAGGYDGKDFLDSVESYDPIQKQWVSMPSMGTAKCDFAMCSVIVTGFSCVGTWM